MLHDKKIFSVLYLLNILIISNSVLSKNAIVQKDLGERTGDRLLIYCATKYLALKHDLDFYYRPYPPVSDQFTFSSHDKPFDKNTESHYSQITNFNTAALEKVGSATLFLAPWNSIDIISHCLAQRHLYGDLFTHLHQMLQPLFPIPTFEKPMDSISVAVHIRKGEGYDLPLSSQQIYNGDNNNLSSKVLSRGQSSDHMWPKKFPPEQYYIDQIKFLTDQLPHKNFTFFIFSDCFEPEKLTQRISEHCNNSHCTFINATSSLKENPIFDIYKMASCDCLIRPDSSFSIIAQVVGNHKVVFSPQKYIWRSNILHISQVLITLFNNQKNNAYSCVLENCNKIIIQQWLQELFHE